MRVSLDDDEDAVDTDDDGETSVRRDQGKNRCDSLTRQPRRQEWAAGDVGH